MTKIVVGERHYFPGNWTFLSLTVLEGVWHRTLMSSKGEDDFSSSLLDLVAVHKELETYQTAKASREVRQVPIKKGECQV